MNEYTTIPVCKMTDRELLHALLDKIVDALEDGCDMPKIQFEHQTREGDWRRASLYASVWRISDEEHLRQVRQVEEYNKRHD